MADLAHVADPKFVAEQYRNAANLNTRISLHRSFSTNKYGWQRWILDQLHFPPGSRLLELGGGTGDLWRENQDRVPHRWRIALSDLSPGMVQQARQNLASIPRPFHFLTIDTASIPFESRSLDGVIANHMLYHVPDIAAVLSEIRRVLKPGGRFYASTVGGRHLQEIHELISRFDPGLDLWGKRPSDSFTLESGAKQLESWFSGVILTRYHDALIVTEPAPLVDYVLSGKMTLGTARRQAFAAFVDDEFHRCGHRFHVTKDSGMFESRKQEGNE